MSLSVLLNMETIYQYSISQVEQQNQVLPTTHLLACDCFIFHLDFTHQLKLCFPQDLNIPLNSIQESFFVPFDVFFSHTQETIQTVLSGSGVSMDFVHVLLPEVHSFAMDVAQEPANAGPRIVPLVLAVLAVTPFDDRDQIERAIMESGQVFNPVRLPNPPLRAQEVIDVLAFLDLKPVATSRGAYSILAVYIQEQKIAHQMRRGTFSTDHEVLMKLKALVHSPFKCKKHGQSSAPVMILVQ
ncbi:Zinc finger, C3HC4 type RING finger family protein [Prunus dulcis]|uniref:Zinc finger, C3HC4 type RING finger family protein n=1 Tax=Prunus dulcis TaxID=3755 RepID=A0A4Y1QUV9_PRUDU|nr:Zinc finger, C3HC4 type RING finger family protein [Prunus dulcis]